MIYDGFFFFFFDFAVVSAVVSFAKCVSFNEIDSLFFPFHFLVVGFDSIRLDQLLVSLNFFYRNV